MLTWETTVEAQALYARGWTKSAIARHLGINRRTVREYLKGQQVPRQRVRSEPEVFAPFAEYARLRLADDPHLWASRSRAYSANGANTSGSVSYTHLRAHETDSYLVCRLLLEKKKQTH